MDLVPEQDSICLTKMDIVRNRNLDINDINNESKMRKEVCIAAWNHIYLAGMTNVFSHVSMDNAFL